MRAFKIQQTKTEMTDTNKTEQEARSGLHVLNDELAGMTAIDLADDNALRFIQRVLESCAPEQDRLAARDMIVAIRTRMRESVRLPLIG
jgi:hypothetical protein